MLKEILNDKQVKLQILSIVILMCLILLVIHLPIVISFFFAGQMIQGVMFAIGVSPYLILMIIGIWIIYRDFIRKKK